jgi:integrase
MVYFHFKFLCNFLATFERAMGSLIRIWKTIPMPTEATIGRNGTVIWKAKGKKRIGKLSGQNRVSIQSDTWTAQYTDETGQSRRVSTKTTNRSVAEQILAQYEKDIDRIRVGVTTREELDKVPIKQISLANLLEQFKTKMIAEGTSPKYIKTAVNRIIELFQSCAIDSSSKIRRETIERWIADEMQRKQRSFGTINAYIITVKSFTQYLTDIGIFATNPLKAIQQLNKELDRRKVRRAMTQDEISQLLRTTAKGKQRHGIHPEERVLIYRLLLGTGLRSTELSLLTPSQFMFDRFRLVVEAKKTKNKKADVLPVKPSLVRLIEERIKANNIQLSERIFSHNQNQIWHC